MEVTAALFSCDFDIPALEIHLVGKGSIPQKIGKGSSEVLRPTREIWVRQWVNYRRRPWLNNLGQDPIILPFSFTLEGLLPL